MKTKIIFTFIALSSTLLFSQKKVADIFFENYSYVKAAELYEETVKKGDSSEHVLTRLGDSYYNNSDTESAAIWYKLALNKYKKVNPEYIYKYIQTQRSLGNYEEADNWLVKFKTIQNDDRRADELDGSNIALYESLKSKQGVEVKIKNLDINSKYSDFGAFVYNNNMYFASARNTDNEIYKWNNEPYLDIYSAEVSNSENNIDSISNPTSINIKEKDRDDVHEASVAITNDGNTMYFTRDNVNKKNKPVYDKKGTSHLKIYKATKAQDGSWDQVVELPFNDDIYSTGHPTLSPDNKILYFVSDREGGFGQTDIYQVAIRGDSYDAPVNLGPKVNTEGREMFPFVAKDSTLYFSSDGYLNLGLLDIFKTNILKDEEAEVENMGAPYNSGFDDFAYFVDSDTQKGYFSSNRADGKGGDDIYGFTAQPCKQMITGTVRDSKLLTPIPMATVQLIDESGKIVKEVTSDENGLYEMEADCSQKYKVLGMKADYKDDLQDVETTDVTGEEHVVDLNLIPLINDNEIVINPIFFDFDKWGIRADAAYELENIVSVMRAHPNMVIKIESHTDSRGGDNYNLKLSDRRAKSTQEYLYSRGISNERIESAIGYGETRLVNKCSNGVKCTAEEHQENRRSKFIILKDSE
ncbi:WD40-like Beta Propeller Repeat [Bizionia echini]|uniref:WD40-like Beta Propeller Repeat n=1 Tax=Bizionia echini TaxID=649333 RepID=A0A1I5C782_9FLAO|nr:OmpA family protein [Bizionia echini]SFN82893.1 WD40-like Beta Propeller Repeat [Bizionia echini]